MAEAFTRKGGKKSGMAAGKGKKTPSASAGGEGALRESEEEAAEQNAAQQVLVPRLCTNSLTGRFLCFRARQSASQNR
jgi:hypothetical protein